MFRTVSVSSKLLQLLSGVLLYDSGEDERQERRCVVPAQRRHQIGICVHTPVTVSQKRIPGILATARARTVGFYNSGLTSASASLPGKFQDIPGPKAYSRTFQVLEILQTQFQDFPGGVGTLKLARSC